MEYDELLIIAGVPADSSVIELDLEPGAKPGANRE